MACSIPIPFWPTSPSCLAWSRENTLAVAGGEAVALVLPRLHASDAHGNLWDVTTLTVNAFTTAEVPKRALLSTARFSIGEEIGVWAAIRVAWSAPGLARHRRCALAVLTSNHVLSVWAPARGILHDPGNWRRELVVNHAVQRYYAACDEGFASDSGDDDSDSEPPNDGDNPAPGQATPKPVVTQRVHYETVEAARRRTEQHQIAQRIHAFAWSPPLHAAHVEEDAGSAQNLDWGHQFLAVATGAGDILVLRVESRHLRHAVSEWNVTVTEAISICSSPGFENSSNDGAAGGGMASTASFSSTAAATQGNCPPTAAVSNGDYVAEDVVWTDWTRERDSYGTSFVTARLACVMRGQLFSVKVRGYTDGTVAVVKASQPLAVDRMLPNRIDISGPLEIVSSSTPQSLVAFGTDAVYHTPIGDQGAGVASHHLDARWDEVTGVAVTQDSNALGKVHIVSLISSVTAQTAALSLPSFISEEDEPSPSWRQAIKECRASYSAELDLEGNVMDRTWGIAASPLANYVATCSTFHPSDALGYVIGSDQASMLNISLEYESSQEDLFSIHPRNGEAISFPVETTLFELKRRMERHAIAADESTFDRQALADWLCQYLPRVDSHGHRKSQTNGIANGDGAKWLTRNLKLGIFLDPELQKTRSLLLADLLLPSTSERDAHTRVVIRKLVSQVLSIPPRSLRTDERSLNVRRLYDTILSRLDPNHTLGTSEPTAAQWHEECHICSASITFQSIKWAICANGHHFTRCALTFLSIQHPGTTKSCGVCGALFLDELAFSVADTRPTNVQEPELGSSASFSDVLKQLASLIDVLYAACDLCVYCSGKFVE